MKLRRVPCPRAKIDAEPICILMALSVGVCGVLAGQNVSPLSFEVASVKAVSDQPAGSTGMAPPIDNNSANLTWANVSLVGVLCRAYNLPRRRNLWVTDKSNGGGKVRSRRPANRLPEWRAGSFLVASWLSNQLSAPVNAASAEIYESGAWQRGTWASRQGGDVPEHPHGYRWMTCRGMLKSVAAC